MTVRRVLQGLGVLVLLAAAGAGVAAKIVSDRLALPAVPEGRALDLVIAPGSSFRGVANDLAAAGGYPHPKLLSVYARWRKVAGDVRAGEYQLAPGLSVDAFLAQVTRGDVVLHSVTVIEGWTFREFVAALHADDRIEPTLAGKTAEEIMQALGYGDEHPEGRFFPDTYRFERGTTDAAILRQAYEAMAAQLASTWAGRSGDCPLDSAYEALTLASIIEKETGRDDEREKIAGVFCRRLKKGMRLQTDPTVIYGIGPDFNGDITRRDLRTDTPYNTYTRGGLPPTPIALPGAASVRASVNPEAGEALYFVATGRDDGSHYFSSTLAEHEAAVTRYLKAIRARRP
ncbi:MAG: endolytic transglycosylase MltG [Pseudomonadota bacterium]